MTKLQRKNILLALPLLPLQFPLIVTLQFGVHFLTGLSMWWCLPISFVIIVMYDVGDKIMWGEE